MNRFAIALSAAAVLGTAVASHAAVITLAGGDAGEGLTLVPSRVVNATNFTGAANTTLQGVVFSRTTPPYAVTAVRGPVGAAGSGFVSGSVNNDLYGFGTAATRTANDNALLAIANTISFKGGTTAAAAQNFTLSNLAPNTPYKLDILQTTSDAGARSQTLTVTGSGGTQTDVVPLVPYKIYDSVFTVTSSSTGTILANFVPSTDGTVFSGVVVSSVPEPASLGLLGLGGLTLLRRRRSA